MLEACIRVVLESTRPVNINISEAELQVLTQPDIWLGSDRSVVQRAIEAALYASIEVMNLARFTMPIEFVAATIVVACHPVNWRLASIYLADHTGTELTVMAGYSEAREKVTSDRLFSICLLCEAEYEIVNRLIENELNVARNLEVIENANSTPAS